MNRKESARVVGDVMFGIFPWQDYKELFFLAWEHLTAIVKNRIRRSR